MATIKPRGLTISKKRSLQKSKTVEETEPRENENFRQAASRVIASRLSK